MWKWVWLNLYFLCAVADKDEPHVSICYKIYVLETILMEYVIDQHLFYYDLKLKYINISSL